MNVSNPSNRVNFNRSTFCLRYYSSSGLKIFMLIRWGMSTWDWTVVWWKCTWDFVVVGWRCSWYWTVHWWRCVGDMTVIERRRWDWAVCCWLGHCRGVQLAHLHDVLVRQICGHITDRNKGWLWSATTGTGGYGNSKREGEDQNITGDKDIEGHIRSSLINRHTVIMNSNINMNQKPVASSKD